MLKLISRLLALAVAVIVAGAMFVTAMAIWSWWEPAGLVSSERANPSEADSATPDRLESTPFPR